MRGEVGAWRRNSEVCHARSRSTASSHESHVCALDPGTAGADPALRYAWVSSVSHRGHVRGRDHMDAAGTCRRAQSFCFAPAESVTEDPRQACRPHEAKPAVRTRRLPRAASGASFGARSSRRVVGGNSGCPDAPPDSHVRRHGRVCQTRRGRRQSPAA